jgi:two-component sensor histidine kinase
VPINNARKNHDEMRSPNVILGAENGNARLRESNHRIANNFMTIATLLRYQTRQLAKAKLAFSADEVREILNETSHRIELVSRLHRRLAEPIAPDMLNLSPYLNDVAETAIDSLSSPGEVELEAISGDMCPVRADHALLIGLILGEVVTSAVRLARRAGVGSKLKLTCGPAEGRLEITLASHGAGLSERLDADWDDRLGLGVAKLLVAQLKAALTFESGDSGPVARLLVPTGIDLSDLDTAGEA